MAPRHKSLPHKLNHRNKLHLGNPVPVGSIRHKTFRLSNGNRHSSCLDDLYHLQLGMGRCLAHKCHFVAGFPQVLQVFDYLLTAFVAFAYQISGGERTL